MKNISEFFKRIGTVQAQEIALRASIQSAIKEFVDIEVPIGAISIKGKCITLKGVSHGARSAIFIHKQQILERANKKGITDIR